MTTTTARSTTGLINSSILLTALAVGLSTGACSKDSSAGRAAGLAPLAPNAQNTASARGPGPSTASPASTSNDLPAPTAAQKQALEQALAVGPHGGQAVPEAVPDVPDEKDTISGTIVLPAANRSKVARGDVIFLAARRAGGPPGPGSMLAVQKLQAEDFPMPFTISNRDAMIPGIPFEGLMSITIRVDKDGDAMTRLKGDVYGQANNVKVGSQKVVVSLDTVASEDRTLAAPSGTMGGMLPSANP